jgi:fumarate reductase subunit D
LGANPEADGSYPNVTPPEILHALRTVPYLELSRLGYTRGMEFIRDHPGQYAKILALKLTKTFSAARTNGWYLHMRGTDRIVSIALSALTTLVLLPLAILGLFRSMQRRNPTWVLLALYAGSCLLSGLIYTVHARYRLLMFPAVIVFAAQGLHELWRARHSAKEEIPMAPLRASLGLAVGIVAVATTADVLTTASEVQRRIALLLGL